MEDDSLYDGLKELVFAMYEASNFYNSTNPSQKDQKKQEEATYKLLTSNPPRHKKREFERGFCNLCNAITKYSSQYYRNKRDQIPLYIRDICIAMMDTETYRHSQYSEKDDYLSLKSDSVTLPEMELLNVTELEWNKDHTKCRKKIKQCKASLIKSALEVDPFRGCPFDKVTGYVSHYNKEPIPGTISPLVLTIHITNPGKWKTRAIHLAMSCIQDRCSYISNRIAAVLRKMKTDCTFDQSNGHRYNLRITHPQNRKGSWNVLAYDWSNATDKMLQDFQEKALSLLFPPEVVEFWHEISTCTKIFRFCDGSQREYVQSNGQPQGLLGSFPAFAFAHHLIMLLTMHMNGFQNIDSTLFYRVLGDDSLICSVKLDPHNYVGRYYRAICMWANMKINLKKSTEVMSWEDTCLVEFAKVNVLDGEFFSPIPFRLACRIADKKRDYYAFAAYIWEQRHGVDNKQIIKRLIDTYYPLEKENKIVNTLVFCGLLPAYTGVGFEEFSDHIVIDTFLLECLLAYWYVNIRTSFLMPLVKDHQIDDIRQYETAFDADPLLRLIPESMEGLLDLVEDPEHKIFRVIQSNLDKQEIIEQILKCSPDQSAIISSKVEITEEDIKAVQALVDLINQCKGNEEMVSYYQTDILDMANKMRSIRSFDIRSIYKSDTWNSRLLGKAVEAFNELFPEDN